MVVGLMMAAAMAVAVTASVPLARSFIHFAFSLAFPSSVGARSERDLRLCIFLPFNFPVAFSEIYFNVFVS